MAHHVTCRDAAIWLRLGASVHWPDIANRSLVTPQRTSLGYDFMWQMPRNSRTRLSVELAAHIQQNLICGFTSKGRSIGTTFDKSCEDGIGYLAPLQPVRDNPFRRDIHGGGGGTDYFPQGAMGRLQMLLTTLTAYIGFIDDVV